jgi:acylphosphatase
MTENPDSVTRRLRITGKVQGVGYRAWTAHRARKLGLVGWVRNLTDGSVEAMIQGPRETLAEMIAACHAGPPLARVTEVKSEDVEGRETFAAFTQQPTAEPG